VADALAQLKERLGKITDLERISRVLSWDQQTMMPPAGSDHRADHLSTLRRLSHELLIDDEMRRLLDELRPLEDSLEPDSDVASLIRVTRRQYEKSSRVPTELRAEMTRASAQARPVWVKAKGESNFELFLPVMERTVELRRRYVDCFDGVEEPYDILLDDFEPYTTTAEVREIFAELKAELVPLIAELRDIEVDDSFMAGNFPVDRQERVAKEVVAQFGFRPDTWRLDPTEHPFASGAGVDDIRITTNYDPQTMKSFFSTMHEYGHGLYSHQLPRHLERLPTGSSCSLGIHESQSRLWENLVGRSAPFWHHFFPQLQEAFPGFRNVDEQAFYRAVNAVTPSLIRVEADQVTYSLHIILRFELEREMIGGLDLRELPQIWNERMSDYLGIDVPDDAHGVLQDVHWGSGGLGYFPTYALGNVVSLQIWERLAADLPDIDEQLARGEFGNLMTWLREHLYRYGRKFTPQETLEKATGGGLDAGPYLRYLRRLAAEIYGVEPAAAR
jgi:carboxypeptidase Taq